MISTPVLVLRKTPYSETSIIAATLSPEHGRIDFMVKGARQISRKKFPQIDLFRELEVHFNHKSSGLNNMHSVEILNSFDAIAHFPGNYLGACEIATFVLRNSQAMIPTPKVYSALKTAFAVWCKEKTEIPWSGLVKLVYLDEHGFLPEDLESGAGVSECRNIGEPAKEGKKKETIKKLVNSVITGSPLPEYPQKSWQKIDEWIDKLCRYHELE